MPGLADQRPLGLLRLADGHQWPFLGICLLCCTVLPAALSFGHSSLRTAQTGCSLCTCLDWQSPTARDRCLVDGTPRSTTTHPTRTRSTTMHRCQCTFRLGLCPACSNDGTEPQCIVHGPTTCHATAYGYSQLPTLREQGHYLAWTSGCRTLLGLHRLPHPPCGRHAAPRHSARLYGQVRSGPRAGACTNPLESPRSTPSKSLPFRYQANAHRCWQGQDQSHLCLHSPC